ncbi:MAG: carbamate kinase [Thermoplasmata archaeon]
MARILVALGGNALSRAGQAGTWAEATAQMRATVPHLAGLVADGHDLILTHGNGPQVGALLRENELEEREVPVRPMDVLGAETQGQIGYLIQQELTPALVRARVPRIVTTVVSRVEVARRDPAFRRPTKPVGRYYPDHEAHLLRKRLGWAMVYDGARGGWRRLVPSPRPVAWVESPVVRQLLSAGWGSRWVPIVTGGGGIPVVAKGRGDYVGVEAVIDKDRTAALVGAELGVDTLAIVTDVPGVAVGFRKSWERWLGEVDAPTMKRYLHAGEFGEGDMAPKIEAAIDFLEHGGRRVVITDVPSLGRALRNDGGTRILR